MKTYNCLWDKLNIKVFRNRETVMVTNEQKLENIIQAACDELNWGVRSFYAAKILHSTQLRLTRSLFDTFYFSCLDESALILSRIAITKSNDSLHLKYLFEYARENSKLFKFAKPGEIERTVDAHLSLLESYDGFLVALTVQRDKNLAHLDLKHINQTNWHESQPMLDMERMEELYKDLTQILSAYFLMFYGREIDFGDWQNITEQEIMELIEHFNAYNARNVT
jgi:hypothetical protein